MPTNTSTKRPPRVASVDGTPQWPVFMILLILRIVNTLTIQTFFQPDEYFQSLEPAWQIAFGQDSGGWITWEWREKLRSAIHPWVFALVYRAADTLSNALATTPAAHADILIIAPKLAQAVFAATMDFYTWRLARTVYGRGSAASLAALALTVFSPWQWYSSVRTFSNSIETTLTVVALDLWPWQWFLEAAPDSNVAQTTRDDGSTLNLKDLLEGKELGKAPRSPLAKHTPTKAPISSYRSLSEHPRLLVSLSLAALACILRPTNGIIWVTIGCMMLFKYTNQENNATLITAALSTGPTILALTTAIDQAHYEVLTLPAYNFLYFNVVQSLSVFYGRNRIDYYFTEGLPLLLMTALPFAAIGVWTSLRPGVDRPQFAGFVQRQTRFVLASAVVATILAFSMIAHKEMRFLYPVLPVLHVLAADPVAKFFTPFPLPASKVRLALLLFGLTLNVYIAAYVSLVHQRGVIDVTHYLRHEAETSTGSVRNTTVAFLMPCHSTPWRSHLVHPEISAWALTCEPPLNLDYEQRLEYLDEADVFYMHPGAWIDENMADRRGVFSSVKDRATAEKRVGGERRKWPEYLVFFEHLEPVMNAVLEDTQYVECWRGFNTHWHDDRRRRGDVVVRCLRP